MTFFLYELKRNQFVITIATDMCSTLYKTKDIDNNSLI